jgi:putative ABC transport system permease protein
MKYFPLVWAALFRRKVRTIFTLLSVLAAFLLFGLLESVRSAFDLGGQSLVGVDRLIIVSKVGFIVSLPKKLLPRIEALPGVARVSYQNWFGGIYQDPKNFFASEAIPDSFLDIYPELHLSPDQRRAFQNTRTGAIVGEALARRFNWKLGDRIPLVASSFPQKNGSNTWTFELVGIYRVSDPKLKSEENELFFNWDYFDQSRQTGNDTVDWYVLKVADRMQTDRIAQQIDASNANSDHETKTQSEQAFNATLLGQFANIGLIVGSIMGAVFFTLVILTGNTMAQAVRERIPEIAILKTLGFSGRNVLTLVLAESVLLLLIGGAVGLVLASVAVIGVRAAVGTDVPMLPVAGSTWLRGMELAVAIGLVVGVLPALRGMRLRIVDALSGR